MKYRFEALLNLKPSADLTASGSFELSMALTKSLATVNENVLSNYRDILTQCRTFYASALKVWRVASLPDSVYENTYSSSQLPLPIDFHLTFKHETEAAWIEAPHVTKDQSSTLPQCRSGDFLFCVGAGGVVPQ
jgi:hypothetical protein